MMQASGPKTLASCHSIDEKARGLKQKKPKRHHREKERTNPATGLLAGHFNRPVSVGLKHETERDFDDFGDIVGM